MKNVRPPQFLTNLYRDMRDRHLLLPVVLLAVALVAVPMLLTSRHSSSTAPATSASPKASGSEAIPAVVTQELGVTNYKKRLNRLQSKDPFQGPPSTQGVSTRVKRASITNANIPSTSSTSSTSTSSTSTSATPSTSSVTPSTSSSTPATGGTSTNSSPSGGSSPQPTTHHNKPTSQLYTYRVSVKVGEPGKLAYRPEVSSLALLPSKSRPVLSFLEANGKRALFNVSTDVDSVKGDGRCAPKPANCQYIRMKPGDKASFHYAPSNKRFNLVLKDIHAVKVGHK
jgi:cell division septation protein DedD